MSGPFFDILQGCGGLVPSTFSGGAATGGVSEVDRGFLDFHIDAAAFGKRRLAEAQHNGSPDIAADDTAQELEEV